MKEYFRLSHCPFQMRNAEKKVPRRHFLKWTGALAAAGAAGIGLGYAANIFGRPTDSSNSTKAASTTSASAISTVTDYSTSTAPTTVTVTTTQTRSAIASADTTALPPATQVPANTFSIFWMTTRSSCRSRIRRSTE